MHCGDVSSGTGRLVACEGRIGRHAGQSTVQLHHPQTCVSAPVRTTTLCSSWTGSHSPHLLLAMRMVALRRGQSGQALATGRPGCTHDVFSHPACGGDMRQQATLCEDAWMSPGAWQAARLPPPPQRRQPGLACAATGPPSEPHFACTTAEGSCKPCTHRLQRWADELGLGSSRRGGPHDQAAVPAGSGRLGALRREHGSLESEGSHSVAFVKRRLCAR